MAIFKDIISKASSWMGEHERDYGRISAAEWNMADLIHEYNEKGFVIVRNVLPPDVVKRVSDHVEWLQKQHPDVDPELLEHWLMREDPFWISLITHPALLDVVQKFLGPNIASFASHYVCKPAFTGKRIHWHQDGSYWPLEPMSVLSMWLAVDASTCENGCMQVVPSSHKNGLRLQGLTPAEFNKHVQEVHAGRGSSVFAVDDNDAVDVQLQPGDISLHHPSLVHGSLANQSARRRCGLTIRYIPTSTRVVLDADRDPNKRSKGSVFLLRGAPDPKADNIYREYPVFDSQKHCAPLPHYDTTVAGLRAALKK